MTQLSDEVVERVARALYASLGFERDDPWDAAIARRKGIGMASLSANQEACLEHARAAIAAYEAKGDIPVDEG